MTKNYRDERTALINSGVITADFLPICETFERVDIDKLLSKPGVEGLRIYLSLEAGEVKLILVGVDAEDRDILPSATQPPAEEDEDDNLLERGERCPSDCPPDSPLND